MRDTTRRIKDTALRDHRRIYQQRLYLWEKRTAAQNLAAEEARLDAYRARWERIRAEEAETPTARAICDRMFRLIDSRRADFDRLFAWYPEGGASDAE